MKKSSKIQLARNCLKDNGFKGYTVVRRSKRPTSKGNKYEWKLFKRFTIWASGREKPLYYGKTSGSGAQATRTRDHRSPMVGDMMSLCPEADFLTQMFVFEFKDRLETNVFDLLKRKGSLFDWWTALKKQARKAEKNPALVFHVHNTRNNYIMLEFPFFMLFLGWIDVSCVNKYFIFNNLIILDLEQFFSTVTPWEFAHCFIDDQVGKQVEENYAASKSKSKHRKDDSNNTIRTIKGRSKLGNGRSRKRLGKGNV